MKAGARTVDVSTADRGTRGGLGRASGVWCRAVCAAFVLLAALALPTPAAADGFTVPADLAEHAVLSCQDLTLSGGATVASEGIRTRATEAGQGHVRSNGDVTLDGGVEVDGDATAGPNGRIVHHGKPSTVTGAELVATERFDCAPIDLATLRSVLEGSNDNAALPQTAKGKDPLGGKTGRSLSLKGHDSLTIPAGSYLFDDLSLAGGASLVLDGPVRILVTGSIDLQGGATVNAGGAAYDLRLWSAGPSVSIGSQVEVRGFLYAPDAEVRLTGKSLLAGALQGDGVEIAGGARVVRVVDDAPPVLEVDTPTDGDLVESCLIPAAGRASDGEGPVTVTVNGAPATVAEDGSFTGSADLATDDPGLVVFEATDRAGNTTRVEVRVEIVPPEVALLSPAPGSLVGERVVDLAGRSGTATEVTVNGVPAQVTGDGTFALPGFDLGEDGLVALTVEGSNCGGSDRTTATLDLDTLAPTVAIDSPSEGTLFGSQPITVSGTVEDAHLDTVTVNGVTATVDGGRFTAEGVPLSEGDDQLIAKATDALGRSTVSAPVVVTLDTTAPTVTITAPTAGTVLDTPTITVSGEVSDPHLDSVRIGDVVATVSGMTFTAEDVPLDEGDNFLVAEATDLAGNGASSPSVVVVLDTLAPEVSLDGAALPELTGETSIPVAGTAIDPHLDAVTVNSVEATVTGDRFVAEPVPLEEGANELVAEAVDTLDHRASSPPVTVTRDTLPPEVAITEPAAGAELDARTVTVRGTVSDPHLARVTVGAVDAIVTDGTFVAEGVELPEGDAEIVAHAVDALDHAADSEAVPVVVDTLPPVVQLDSPADPLVAASPVTVTGQVEEPHLESVLVAGVEAVVGPDGAFSVDGVELAEGDNALTAVARDTFGHEATSEAVVYVLDTQPPEITIASPLDGAVVFERQVEVVGTAADPHLESVSVNGVAATLPGDGTFSATVPVVDGANLLTAVATDRAGHEASTAVSVFLDTLPPGVSVDTPEPGACLAAGEPYTLGGAYADPNPATGVDGQPPPVRIEVRGSDGATRSYPGALSGDGTRWSAAGIDLGSAEGSASASIVATDVLGNASQTAASWRLDATVPTVALTLDGAPFPGSGPGATSAAGAVATPLNREVAAGVQVDDGPGAAAPRAVVTLDGSPYAPGTPITGEGEHLLVARASDCAGHTATVHAFFRIDRSLPTLVSSEPASGSRVTTEITAFGGVASEPLAAASVAGEPASVDGTSFLRSPFAVKEGPNEVSVELVDRAGNRSTQTVTFDVRTVPLSVELVESGAPLSDGASFLRPVRPEVRASDSRAVVTATLDGAPFVSGTEISASGSHHLVATARDDWDRTASADVHFTVDLGPGPEVAITSPVDGATLSGPTTAVEGTVSGDGVTVSVNGIPATVSGDTWRAEGVPLDADVPNALEAVARDRAGRTASDGVVVQVTAEGPQILILDPPDGVVTGLDRIDVSGVVVGGRRGSVDGMVTVENLTMAGGGSQVDVALAADGSFRATDVPLVTGSNSLRASTRDPVDRVGSAEVSVVADFEPPVITVSVGGAPLADGAAFGQPVTVTVGVADDAGNPPAPVVRLNGDVVAETGTAQTEIQVSDAGGYVLAVVARDGAGNEARTERSFTVDFGGCALSDVQPGAGAAVSGESVTLAGRSGAAAAVTVRVPSVGGGFQDYPAAVADGTFLAGDVPLPTVGENALVLVCTDATGGETTQDHPIERLPAGEGPTVTIEQPADGTLLSADAVAVEGTVSGGTVTVNGVPATITSGSGADAFRADGVSLVEGPNVLGARALDGAGRTGTDRVVIDRDTQSPQVQITRPDNKTHVGHPANGSAAVDVAGLVDLDTEPHLERVSVASSAGEVTATVDPATGAFLAEGVPVDPAAGAAALQTLTVTATDRLGHSGTSSVGVYYDPAGPAIVLDAPDDLTYYGVDAPTQVSVSGDAWAADGARVSINGIDLDPSTLSWDPAGADGRRHTRFTASVAVPDADGAFGVIARVTELDDDVAQDRRLLFHDTVAPTVEELVPSDGASGVDPDSLMLVLFSEPILHASLETADGLTLSRADATSVVGRRTVAGQAVALAPGARLEEGGSYVFRAGTGITDRAGNPLEAPAESGFTVAASSTASAPSVDALPGVLCADEVTVTGTASPGATIEVRDGDLTFRGFADAGGRFAVTVPTSGSGYHLLRIRAIDGIDGARGAASPETTAVLRIDCSAPRVLDARFDRDLARITIELSEPVDPATVAVGGASDAIRVTDAEAPEVYRAPALSFAGESTVELALDSASDAWWRDRPVRLQVGPPAADLEGNVTDAVFETVFFPGSSTGLAGGFLFGEAYDDLTGRPLAGASAQLFVAGTALPGTVPAGTAGSPMASASTDIRGRFVFAGSVPSGRYVLALGGEDTTTVYRRLSLSPTRGLVPFDARPTPRAESAGSIDPSAGGAVTAGELRLEADPGALAGADPVAFQLTPLSGQGLPDLLPLGWTPAVTVEVRGTVAGAALSTGAADWLPGGVRLIVPVPTWVASDDPLVAVRHAPNGGTWTALAPAERLADGTVQVILTGPGVVSLVVPDRDPATAPLVIPAVEGEALVGVDSPSTTPDLTADLTLDPPVVPPTGRSRARVIARSADGVTPWPSGLAVQAYLEEKLILAGGGGQVLEAPFSVDLVLYHPGLDATERAGAEPGAAGAMEFAVSPSPRAAQVLLDVGYENLRVFPFPEEVEREPVVGPTGGTVESAEGVELVVPEGALSVKVPVSATLLDAEALAALPAVAGYDTVAAVRVDLSGKVLGRAATLSLPAPAGLGTQTPGDPRLILSERVDVATDGRGAYPKLTARARIDGTDADARVVASPDLAGALPLEGLVRGGLYLVLRAQAPIGFATGFVHAANGTALAGSRVTADGLGTADVTGAGGRYSVPVPASATAGSASLRALHPTLDEVGTAPVPALDPGQVATVDLTVQPVAPTVISVAPSAGATDQPVGSEVSILFSEPLAASTVSESTLTVELAGADGTPSGLYVDGDVTLSADGTRVVFTPDRPLLPGRTFLARFDGGVADAGGTFYDGAPMAWTFGTSTAVTSGGQVHPERFHIRVPVDGLAEIYGDPGAVPSVPAGSTPWVVVPDLGGPVADPTVDSYPVSGDGSFTGTAGHPPDFAVALDSEVWVKVFDPSGTLAAEIRLGPFVTPDGKGFVAPAGEALEFRSVDGVVVQVPAGAFDEATLVKVTMQDPATLGMEIPRGLAVGAYVSLDFDGEAKESLRLAVPAPAEAPAGAQVFVAEPVALPWGRRFKFLTLGAVEERSDGKYLSNDPSLWPDAVGTVSGNSLAAASAENQAGVQSGNGLSAQGEAATLAPKRIPKRFLRERMQELAYRSDAVWFYEFGASWAVMGGSVAPFSLGFGIGLEAIYNKIADLMVYVPSPRDWNGGFVLPVLTEEPLEIVRRDTATGWVLSETAYDPLPAGGGVVDVGVVPGGPARRPLLEDASPFRLIRFQPPGPGGTLSLGLELQVHEELNGTVVVSSVSGLSLEAGSSVALYDLTPALPADPDAEPTAPIAGPSTTVCDADAPWELDPMPAGEEMMVVVGPGGLDASSAGRFSLQFDRPLVDLTDTPVDQAATLVDLGPLDDCEVASTAGYPRTIPLTLDQASRNSRLTLDAALSLPSGHRFRLELKPDALKADGAANGAAPLAYWPTAPHRFELSTAEVPGEVVAGTPSDKPALGTTDRARNLVKLGNLLFVASEDGDLVTIDTSDPTEEGSFQIHSIFNRGVSFPRALATDGHNRVFYSGLLGPFWVTRVLRREDAREASAECRYSPDWAAGLPCFDRVDGNVRVAYQSGYNSGLTPSEWLATGTLPTGTPTALSILTQDETGRELPLDGFVAAYTPGADGLSDLTPDAEGIYTFDLALKSTLVRSRAGAVEPSQPAGTEPPSPIQEWRNRGCEGEEGYDRFQRVTVDNLTTGQSWSLDIENPWPPSSGGAPGDGSAVLHDVRARRGDKLRVRYNLRAIGHLAIVGSGITVLDLNRFYRLGQTVRPIDNSQCGRRLGTYEGQEIDYPACAPSSASLYAGLAWVPEVAAISATGCDDGPCRGDGRIDVYAPIIRLGAVHATSPLTQPGALAPEAELAACIDRVGDQWAFVDDVSIAPDVKWLDRGVRGRIDGSFDPPADGTTPRFVQGDLMALALGDAGVYIFDISERTIMTTSRGPALIGHLRVDGHSAYRVQVDPARHLLFAGGTELDSGDPIIDVWDLASVNGAPDLKGLDDRPVPQASLHAAWGAKDIGLDASGTGLLYTWSDEGGAQAVPFESPDFVFSGLYRPDGEDGTGRIEPEERPTARFVPLGVPLHALGDSADGGAGDPAADPGAGERQDERDATAAFKLRVALPGSLGPELTAKVQSLRTVPPNRYLGSESVGASVTPPGGPGWPDNEVIVRLRRLGVGLDESGGAALSDGEAGPLGNGYQLYESVETVLLVADPRAGRDYRRQDAAGTEADEEGQCRRCDWPAYLPDPASTAGTSSALDDVKELLAGRAVRAFLFASNPTGDVAGATTAQRTREAIAWFATEGANYPAPAGSAQVAAPAAPVPSPLQVALAEPPRNPAMWNAGEAGVSVALTGGELMLSSADHAVRGRAIPFVFERDYRSGTLGYGPLGAAGWWSPLFAQVRELPSGEVVYFDGRGHGWRFPPAADGDPPGGYDEEAGASYDTPEGLFVRLQKLPGGQGWILVGPQHATARFDGDGRLIELGDRHYRGGTAGVSAGGSENSRGNHLRLRYDPFGQLVLVVDDLGRSYRFDYYDDPRPAAEGGDGPRYGLLESITDFVDRSVEYRWDEERRLTEVRMPEVENPVDAYAEFSYTGASRPTLRYRYDPPAGVSADDGATSALLHGDFAPLRLAACILPEFVAGAADAPRARFAYDETTGRVTDVAFPTPDNVNTASRSVAWKLTVPGGADSAGPVDQVDVRAPWGHVVSHHLADGRLIRLEENLEVVHAGQAPAEEAVETSFEYADDGRLLTTSRPDGGRVSLCYADGEGGADCQAGGSSGAGSGGSGDGADRLARPNVVARVQAATTQASQGTADYTEIVSSASYQEDNVVSSVTDGENRTIDLSVPEASKEVRSLFHAENVGARTVYDAYGRPKSSAGLGTAAPEMSLQYGEDAHGVAGAGLVSRIERGAGDRMASWRTLSYDDAYNVSESRSSYGERRTMSYDSWDRPVREVQGLSDGGPLAPVGAGTCGMAQGKAMERAYDAAGHVVRERRLQDVVDPATGAVRCRWQETRYEWNLREQLVGVEQSHLADPTTPGGVIIAPRTVQKRSYDEDGRLAQVTQAAVAHPAVVTTYRYDAAGRIAGVRTGGEGERLLGYDTMSRVVLRTDGDSPQPGTWRGRYDAWDRLVHEQMPTGAVRRTRYNRANQPIEEQTFSADPLSDPEADLLARTRYDLTSFGAVRRVIEDLTEGGERRVTETEFDGSGRPTLVLRGPEGAPGALDTDHARREMETVYEPSSGRVLVRRFGGAYGAAGDPALHETRFEYSTDAAVPWPVRQVSYESVPGQTDLVETFTTTLERDVLGRVLSQTRSDGEQRSTLYDRSSNDPLRVRTGAGTEMSYSRDGRGLPVQVTRPLGRGATRYAYDLDGVPLIEQTTTADGGEIWETDTRYDATGRIAAIDYADGTREERTYRADSQVATVTTRDGLTLTMTYDVANRLRSVTPSADTATTTRLDAGDRYAYDSVSRPTRMERGSVGASGMNPALTLAYPSYDLASRPGAEVVGERDPLSWTYDTFDRPVEVELPSGPGRAAGGSLLGFQRVYDTLDRLETATGLGATGLSSTPLGATWSWGGASRMYGMDTLGALGTAMRYGYHGGAGPQVIGTEPGSDSVWKLGRLSWGAGASAPTAAPTTSWGDFGYGWRGHEGEPSDGVKIGRQVLSTQSAGATSNVGVLDGLGWSWDYDAGVRLATASSGAGDLSGRPLPEGQGADRFTYEYGAGDELLGQLREATGTATRFTTGDYGRIATRDGVPFTYDPVGRRLEDDRFIYHWDWRGQLIEVDVKTTWPDEDNDGEPDVSPYAGHRVRYDYDARGRLTRRLHEGPESADTSRPFIEERVYVWEEDRLAAESAYGASATPGDRGALRWRRTYVPGPSRLDDPAQVVVEIAQPGSPYTGEARTYTYLHDELGTILGLVAEDEGTDPANPPIPIRYRYTPYGEAHAETGPELLRARYDNDLADAATPSGTVTQAVTDETAAAPGGILLSWSLPLDESTLGAGLVVEKLQAGAGWTAVPAGELVIGHRPDDGVSTGDDATNLRLLLASGWQRGTSYRIRLTQELTDRLHRSYGQGQDQAQDLQWSIPAAPATGPVPAVQYDQRFPAVYESYQAAAATAGGRFPGGQSRLFQGLWTDPVTGMSYARARWYDARNAHWLSEDPMGAVDSTNLYAFVGWQPNMGVDPLGMGCRRPVGHEEQQRCIEEGARWAAPRVQEFQEYIESPEGREAMRQAAIRDEAIVDTASRAAPYVEGSLQIVWGCTEAAAGATVAGGSAGIAAVPGVLVMAHGADVCATGFRMVWTGEHQETLTKQGLRAGLEEVGVEPGTAEMISSHADAVISAVGVASSARLLTLGPATSTLASSSWNLATGTDEAVFWSGIRRGDASAAAWVSRHGGATLETTIAERGIQLPVWDPANPASLAAWRRASEEFAAGARGSIRVLQTEMVRVNSIWAEVEFPALKANPNVTSITAVNPETGTEVLLWSR